MEISDQGMLLRAAAAKVPVPNTEFCGGEGAAAESAIFREICRAGRHTP